MQPIWEIPPYTAEQIDKLQLLRMVEDYSFERVELWLRTIKASQIAARVPSLITPGQIGDPRR